MVKIISDSTCDLSPELIKENDIRVIPLYVNFGDESFKDGIDITPAELLDRIDRDGVISKTSAVPIGIYTEEFSKMKSEADAVIYYCISSEFSSSCQNAVVAAGELENVYVVETKGYLSDHFDPNANVVRLSSKVFLDKYDNVFVSDCEIWMRTDNRDLYIYSLMSFSENGYVLSDISFDLHNDVKEELITTEYEDKFSNKGLPIYAVRAIKKSVQNSK